MMGRLAEKLKELRTDKGYSVREFARKIEKSPGYVSQIEARGETPSAPLLCEIADIYGISAEELLELAKIDHLDRVQRQIESKQASALALHRKARK